MDFKETTEIIEKLKVMNDEELDVFVMIAEDKGLTSEPDELRRVIKNLKNTK